MNGYNVDRTASEAANLSDDAGSLKPRPTSARKSRLLGYSLLPPNYRKLHLPRNCICTVFDNDIMPFIIIFISIFFAQIHDYASSINY